MPKEGMFSALRGVNRRADPQGATQSPRLGHGSRFDTAQRGASGLITRVGFNRLPRTEAGLEPPETPFPIQYAKN
jgi:hypothetical protein